MERDAKKLQPPDCDHADCQTRHLHNQELIGGLLAGNASPALQQEAGALLHDALILLNALPQELVSVILRSHGKGVVIGGGRSFEEAKASVIAQGYGQAPGQAWPSKGSEKGN